MNKNLIFTAETQRHREEKNKYLPDTKTRKARNYLFILCAFVSWWLYNFKNKDYFFSPSFPNISKSFRWFSIISLICTSNCIFLDLSSAISFSILKSFSSVP